MSELRKHMDCTYEECLVGDESPCMLFTVEHHLDVSGVPSRRYDVHKDCSPCPQHEQLPCPLVGTGAHEPIDHHLVVAHFWSRAKCDGVRVGARVNGHDEIETLAKAHDFVLLFQPTTFRERALADHEREEGDSPRNA